MRSLAVIVDVGASAARDLVGLFVHGLGLAVWSGSAT